MYEAIAECSRETLPADFHCEAMTQVGYISGAMAARELASCINGSERGDYSRARSTPVLLPPYSPNPSETAQQRIAVKLYTLLCSRRLLKTSL